MLENIKNAVKYKDWMNKDILQLFLWKFEPSHEQLLKLAYKLLLDQNQLLKYIPLTS